MVTMIRRGLRIGLMAGLAVLLGACLRAEQSLTLNPDNTVDGTITLAVSEQLIELSGQNADDVLAQMTQGDSPIPDGVEVQESDYDEDGFVGKTYTFSGATLEQISQTGDLTITREGDTFVVDGALDLSAGSTGVDPSDPTVQQLLDQFDVSLSVTFPGAVSENDGTLDGRTVTWTPAFGENTTLHAVGSAVGGGASSALIWIVVALIVVLVVVVVLLVMRGRKKPAPADGGDGTVDEGEAADVPVGTAPVPPSPVATEPAPSEPTMTEPSMTPPEAATPPEPEASPDADDGTAPAD